MHAKVCNFLLEPRYVLLLLAGGTACQIYFTIVDEEYFHGGYGYYVKPWSRAQPYLIGIVLGYILHK